MSHALTTPQWDEQAFLLDTVASALESAHAQIVQEGFYTDIDEQTARAHARAAANVLYFGTITDKALLLVMRQMEMAQSYQHLGYTRLQHWAVSELAQYEDNLDKLKRMALVAERVFPVLDRGDIVIEGQPVTVETLVASAEMSSLMKLSSHFFNGSLDVQTRIVQGLLAGEPRQHVLQAIQATPAVVKFKAALIDTGEHLEYRFYVPYDADALFMKRVEAWMDLFFTPEGALS